MSREISVNTSAIDFGDLTPITIPVTNLFGKNYVLKEASAEAAVKYRNILARAARMTPDGKAMMMDNFAQAETALVSMCLFEEYEDPKTGKKERPVPEQIISKWPSRIQKALYARIVEISDLTEEGETLEALEKRLADTQAKIAKLRGSDEALKNGHEAMTASSV